MCEGKRFPNKFKLVMRICCIDRKMVGLKVTSVWAVLHTLLTAENCDSVNRFGVQPLSISSAFFLSPFPCIRQSHNPVVSAEWIRLSPWHRMKAKSTGIKFQCNCLLNCGLQLLKSYPWFCVTTAVMNSVCLWFSNWQHHAKSEKHTTDWSNSEDRGRRKWEPITDASDYWLAAIYSSYRLISNRLKGKSRCQMGFIPIRNPK